VLALVLAAGASAAVPPHTGQTSRASLWTKLCSERQTLRTKQVIPDNGHIQSVDVAVNRHWLTGWPSTSHSAEFGGNGVIAGIAFQKRAAPATVRLASIRNDCAQVHVLIVWR